MIMRDDSIPIYCAFDELADINSLIPNQHRDKQVQLLKKIIKNKAWRAPITVSNLIGFILRGHGSLLAAKHLGVDQVSIDPQDYERPKSGRTMLPTPGNVPERGF